jgi:hypothetical protein
MRASDRGGAVMLPFLVRAFRFVPPTIVLLSANVWIDPNVNGTTVVNSPNNMFLASELSEGSRLPDSGEIVVQDGVRMVTDSEITHGASCVTTQINIE